MTTRLLTVLLLLFGCFLYGQDWSVGLRLEKGIDSHNRYTNFVNDISEPVFHIDKEYGLAAILDYSITDHLSVGVRPTLFSQRLTVRFPSEDQQMSARMERIYSTTLLLPLRIDYNFGTQRYRPGFAVAAGILTDLDRRTYASGIIVEPILPYVEVSIGVRRDFGRIGIKPEIQFRESLSPIIRPTTLNSEVSPRWQSICVGLSVFL